jgi:hypothetical protein
MVACYEITLFSLFRLTKLITKKSPPLLRRVTYLYKICPIHFFFVNLFRLQIILMR